MKSEINTNIHKRIEESRKRLNKKEQRAELLKRNDQFLQEYKEKITFDLGFKKYPNISREWLDLERWLISLKNNFVLNFSLRMFCRKWRISLRWDGRLESLGRFVHVGPMLSYDPGEAMEENIDFLNFEERELSMGGIKVQDEQIEGRSKFLFIKIDPWTTGSEIKNLLPRVRELQKRIFNFTAEQKEKFSRDLCWYDLKNKFGMPFKKIAELWIKYGQDDIDILAIRNFRENIRRSQNDENLKELKKRGTDLFKDEKLLREIKSGKMKNYKEYFDYWKGEVIENLQETMKKAVQRIARYIKQETIVPPIISIPQKPSKKPKK